MHQSEASIRNIKTRQDAEQVAQTLMAETTTEQHATENDPVWERTERNLLVIILLCTAEHCPGSESPLDYARNLLNEETTVSEQATTEAAKTAWNEFVDLTTDRVRASAFAGVKSRLLYLS